MLKIKEFLCLLRDFSEKENIPVALIGALALKVYGLARTTADIDLITAADSQKKIIAFLENLGFETIHVSAGFSNHLHPLGGRIDWVYVKGHTFEQIFTEIRYLEILPNLTFPVVKPEHLVALKLFALKNDPSRKFKELGDLKFLLELPGINLEEVQGYFKRYGQEGLWKELQSTES